MRLNKRMAELGLASRREADDWIAKGWVKVNGKFAEMGMQVAPDVEIEIDKLAKGQQAKQVTVLINKPLGLVSGQAEDGHEPAITLVQPQNRWDQDNARFFFHPSQLKSLVPAGRLDIDSTGLLVLTQDGRVAKTLIGEDSPVEKEYLVRVRPLRAVPEGEPWLSGLAMRTLQHGLELDGRRLKPARVSWANEDQLRFVLREGRKRQIRRMCELVDLEVTDLMRIRVGPLLLGDLPEGKWRHLLPAERNALIAAGGGHGET
jgi:23S rRNA pseudouridine2604 synthase